MNEMVNIDANVTKDHVSLNTSKVDTRNITYFKCLTWNINKGAKRSSIKVTGVPIQLLHLLAVFLEKKNSLNSEKAFVVSRNH